MSTPRQLARTYYAGYLTVFNALDEDANSMIEGGHDHGHVVDDDSPLVFCGVDLESCYRARDARK